ncbi:MAG: 1-deoxy-D-xylulose-5-phosphate synthase N-terminal domain-containing protein, partial [archaeon]|nr:1-deoxy-D-xylulose-5-phosphate synthase N-terminal domain-containing protein [archaeon]
MVKNYSMKELKLLANDVRQHVITMLAEAKSGHSGGSLGSAELFVALYFHILKHDPSRPDWEE